MSFGEPRSLFLLATVPLAGLVLAALWRWRSRAEAAYAGRGELARLSPDRSPARRGVKAGLLVGALALLSLALARPQFGSHQVPVERRGVDLMIVLDVSQSMEATDVTPSRRERARQEIDALLGRLQGDRVGLVLVSANAFLRSPVTSDLGVVEQLVASASQERLLLEAGTALAGGIDTAVQALSDSKAATGIILVVSDGEDHEAGAAEAAGNAHNSGLLVYAAGVGTAQGGTIPEVDQATGTTRLKIDPATGAPLVSRLNDGLLRDIAAAGGGRYVALEGPGAPLSGLADEFARLQTTVFATDSRRQPEERFQWFVAAAGLLLAVEMLVSSGKGKPFFLGRRATALGPLALVAGLLAAGCASSVHSLNEDGNRLFAQGRYDQALESYQRAQAERPDLYQLDYNIGNTLHRLGDYARAIEETRRATSSPDADLASRAHYSLGNHNFRLGQLQAAFDAYKQALILNPDDIDSKYNLELVSRLLAQQPPPSSQGSGSGQQPPGQATPSPGESSGQGQPQAGQPAPSPGPPAGQTGAQPPAGGQQPSLSQALAGIKGDFTIEDALRVLDILRQQQSQLGTAQQPGSGRGQDY